MVATLVCGYVMMYSEGKEVHTVKPAGFVRHMAIVGGLRFCTVLAGLLALNYVAVSFTETVKSSAPAFTVVISRLILGQTTERVTVVTVWCCRSDHWDIRQAQSHTRHGRSGALLGQRAELQRHRLHVRPDHQC